MIEIPKCPTCGDKWPTICSDGFHARQIPKCVSCGRRPSERLGRTVRGVRRTKPHRPCHDPIHDLADLGPAAVALLREWMATPRFETYADYQAWEQDFLSRVNPLLAAAPEVKP